MLLRTGFHMKAHVNPLMAKSMSYGCGKYTFGLIHFLM